MEARAVGPSDAPPVLFIHGSPGSWDNYLDVIPNLPDLQLIFFDRPGFGGSQPLESLPNLKQQANAASQVLLHFSREPAIVVGHSYGGPIALEMALQSRTQVRALVLLGASVDPELEELRWYNYLTSALEFMIPGALVRSNDEMITVKQQLEIQKREILNPGSEPLPPIYVMHGTEDGLVPVENVNYIYEYPGAHSNLLCIHVLQDQNHFIPWNQPVMLARMIQAAVKGECSVSMDYSHATE
tara:strand:- start:71550 stop:72275 length:726 start_codon:yes stop_codon:yes gene_type:complete